MCMGPTHAAWGAVAGAAYGESAGLPVKQTALLTVFTAGLAVLPDIDHLKATMARSFGFLTWGFAWLVGKIARGHRMGTHSFLGAAVLTALAMTAVHWRHDIAGRIGLCFLLSLTFAAVFYTAKVKRFGLDRHAADAVAIGLAILLAFTGWGLALVGLATLLGCLVHIAADMLTKERCPLLFPLTRTRFGLLPEDLSFTTDTWPEHRIVAPLAGLALILLAFNAVAPGIELSVWATALHAI